MISKKRILLIVTFCFFASVTLTVNAQQSAIELFEIQSKALGHLSDKIARMSIAPVVAALKRASKNDPEMLRLLSKIDFSATPHIMRPANAYASRDRRAYTGGAVEIDLGWFQQANAIAQSSALIILDPDGKRKHAYKIGFRYGQMLGTAMREQRSIPNFTIDIEDFVTDPLEISFVDGLATRLTDEAMAWTVLHEIAHHELGHLTPGKYDDSLATSRRLELEADDWAHRKMEELDIPLYGVMTFMQVMDIFDQIQAQVGLQYNEAESTHPSWSRRLSYLRSNFDVSKSTSKGSYRIFMTKLNLAGPGAPARIERVGYAIPRNPREFGCIGFVTLGDTLELAIAEARGGKAYLYQVPEGEHIEVQIPTPGKTFSQIVTTVKNDATGQSMQGVNFAWEQPFVLYGEVTKQGIRVGEALKISPRSLITRALNEMRFNNRVKRATMAALDRKMNADCDLALAFANGRLQRHEYLGKSQGAAQAYAGELTRIMGEQDFARFQSVLMSSQLVQSGMRQLQELLESTPN